VTDALLVVVVIGVMQVFKFGLRFRSRVEVLLVKKLWGSAFIQKVWRGNLRD